LGVPHCPSHTGLDTDDEQPRVHQESTSTAQRSQAPKDSLSEQVEKGVKRRAGWAICSRLMALFYCPRTRIPALELLTLIGAVMGPTFSRKMEEAERTDDAEVGVAEEVRGMRGTTALLQPLVLTAHGVKPARCVPRCHGATCHCAKALRIRLRHSQGAGGCWRAEARRLSLSLPRS
jgi:hypothetical protein